jgi:hypothetical protein
MSAGATKLGEGVGRREGGGEERRGVGREKGEESREYCTTVHNTGKRKGKGWYRPTTELMDDSDEDEDD